jgi:hypothetical protein
MNHLTALIVTLSAFASGLYGIYKFIRVKYVSYDTEPIRYWLDRPTKIKKRYKTFKNRKKKALTKSKITSYYSYGKKHYKA